MALEGYPAAVPVARAVLEHSPHSLLVGPGARAFATALNIPPVDDPASLLMPLAAKRYAEWVAAGSVAASPETRKHSDTVGILVRDAADRIAAGAATSGMQFKTPGRVGDSPVTGSGLFAEDGAGASVATGDGDRMLRHCIAVRVVDRMGAGEGAEEACVGVVRRLAEREPECQAAVVAMKADGSVGGASTHGGFYVTVWKEGAERQSVVRVEGISGEEWLHSCV